MVELIEYLKVKMGKDISPAEVSGMNPTHLAYVGDAVYEAFVRSYLMMAFKEPMHKLHNRSVDFVRAGAQSRALQSILPILDEDELYIVKRGRNTKSANIPAAADMIEYRRATAFESLLGYLYLCGRHERLLEILWRSLDLDEQNDKESDDVWDK